MKFYDLHVHSAFSEGKSSLKELAEMAKTLGYKGICFSAYYKDRNQQTILQTEIEKIKQQTGIEIFLGFEARSVKELQLLAKRRREFDILLVRGGNLRLNRKACETPEVDILTHPEYERNDSGFNHILAKLARKNEVAIEINFREVLNSSKKTRSLILKNIQQNVKIAKKYKVPIIISSGAISHWELKAPEVLISFGCLVGLELKEAKETLSKIPEKIIKKIEERKNKEWIMPGVKVIK